LTTVTSNRAQANIVFMLFVFSSGFELELELHAECNHLVFKVTVG